MTARHVQRRGPNLVIRGYPSGCQTIYTNNLSNVIDGYTMAKPLTPALDAEQFAFPLNGGLTLRGYRGEVSEGAPLVLLPVSYTHLTLPTNREV